MMRNHAANLLKMLERHRGESISALATEAVSLAKDSMRTAFWLRTCDEVGPGVRCTGPVVVKNQGRIAIARRVRLKAVWNPIELSTGPGAELTIGEEAFINYGVLISARKRVSIGRSVMIGNHTIIADTEHPGPLDGSSSEEPRAIVIEDGAWLAVRVVVLPGAKIGANTVIRAGSVVSGEIPSGVIAGGIPAQVLRPIAAAG
jgi:acetyltransferase-like isoleucine patch superfamily enzyme